MHILAHNGVDHATTTDSIVHNLPILILVTIIFAGILVLSAYILSKPVKKKEN